MFLSHINVFLPLPLPTPVSKNVIMSWGEDIKKNYPDARSKKDGGCWQCESS